LTSSAARDSDIEICTIDVKYHTVCPFLFSSGKRQAISLYTGFVERKSPSQNLIANLVEYASQMRLLDNANKLRMLVEHCS
jgi:hypothetical protein